MNPPPAAARTAWWLWPTLCRRSPLPRSRHEREEKGHGDKPRGSPIAEDPGSIQSAAARRSVEAEVRKVVAKFAPAQIRLVAAMRRSLRKRLPTAHEVVYEYRDWFVISYSP